VKEITNNLSTLAFASVLPRVFLFTGYGDAASYLLFRGNIRKRICRNATYSARCIIFAAMMEVFKYLNLCKMRSRWLEWLLNTEHDMFRLCLKAANME
jgi:hypothetical protein